MQDDQEGQTVCFLELNIIRIERVLFLEAVKNEVKKAKFKK